MESLRTGSQACRRLTPAQLVRRFWRDRKGVAAIEFAALAVPFLLLLFAILESCIAFAANQLMANAVEEIGRQYRTGELRPKEVSREDLRRMVCDRITLLVREGCPDLKIDLRSFDTFEDAAAEYDKGVFPTTYLYEPGIALSKNMLRVYYSWPVITDFMRKSMSNLPEGKTLLFATTTWQNEPY